MISLLYFLDRQIIYWARSADQDPVDISLFKRLQNLVSIRNSIKSSQTISVLELL